MRETPFPGQLALLIPPPPSEDDCAHHHCVLVLTVDEVVAWVSCLLHVEAVRPLAQGHTLLLRSAGRRSVPLSGRGSPHALSGWVGELTGRAFKACASERGLEEEQVSFVTRNHPLPLTATQVTGSLAATPRSMELHK